MMGKHGAKLGAPLHTLMCRGSCGAPAQSAPVSESVSSACSSVSVTTSFRSSDATLFISSDLVVARHKVLLRKVANRDLVGPDEDGVLRQGVKVSYPIYAAHVRHEKAKTLDSRAVSFACRLVQFNTDPDTGLRSELSLPDELDRADSGHVVVTPDFAACADLVVVGNSLCRRRIEGNGLRNVSKPAHLVGLQVGEDRICSVSYCRQHPIDSSPFRFSYSSCDSSNLSTAERSENSPGRALGSVLSTCSFSTGHGYDHHDPYLDVVELLDAVRRKSRRVIAQIGYWQLRF